MATRKPNRRPVAPHSPHQRRHHSSHSHSSHSAHSSHAQPPSSKPNAPISFLGVSDDAFTVVLAALLAKQVTITAVDGTVYSGLFGGTERSPSKQGLLLLLRYARVEKSPTSKSTLPASAAPLIVEQRGLTAKKILIPVLSVTALRAAPPDFAAVAPAPRSTAESPRAPRGFATDADISRGTTGAGRQLQRFEHFSDIDATTGSNPTATTLDEQTFGDIAAPGTHPKRDWDQFQVNEAKFGVTTTFDENEYTTRIDRGGADFQQRLRHATRLASEIKADATATDNPHLREERGLAPDDSMDEEDRYSTVNRSSHPSARPSSVEAPADRPTRTAPQDRPKLSYAAAVNSRSAQSPSPAQVASPAHPAASKPAPSAKPQPTKQRAPPAKQQYAPARTQVPTKPAPQAQKPAPATKPSIAPTKVTSLNKPSVQQQQSHSQKSGIGPNSPTPEGTANTTPASSSATGSSLTSSSKTSQAAKQSGGQQSKDGDTERPGKSGHRERGGREHLPQIMKVRNAHTSRSSPSQTRNSPLPTAGTVDTQAVSVLNLDAHTPNLGPEKIKKFEEYKTNMEIQSIADNREKITDDLKKFSTQLDSRNGPLRRGQNLSANVSSSSLASTVTAATNEVGGEHPSEKGTEESKRAGTKTSENKDVAGRDPGDPTDKQKGSEDSTGKKEGEGKPKARPKSRLNPNAAEFKMNPNAPTFTPGPSMVPTQPQQHQAPQPQQAQQPQQPAYSTYMPQSAPHEFSQPMPTMPQGYPIMHVGQMAYAQPYTMMVPAVPTTIPAARGGQVYMQGAPVTFPGGQVPARFPQSMGMPVSYGYPQVGPMVLPPQRIHPGPPPYPQVYNHPPFPGGQGGGSPISPPMQQPVYPPPPAQPSGPVHVQGPSMPMNGRSGHGNSRRGGLGRPRGRHHGHHNSHHNGQGSGQGHAGNNTPPDRSSGRLPESNTPNEAGQR